MICVRYITCRTNTYEFHSTCFEQRLRKLYILTFLNQRPGLPFCLENLDESVDNSSNSIKRLGIVRESRDSSDYFLSEKLYFPFFQQLMHSKWNHTLRSVQVSSPSSPLRANGVTGTSVDLREMSYLFQRLSVIVQRFNSVLTH